MAEHPRDELRRRITEALTDLPDPESAADSVMALFGVPDVREDYRDEFWTVMASPRDQIVRRRFIVAELAREGEPERIEGAWRG